MANRYLKVAGGNWTDAGVWSATSKDGEDNAATGSLKEGGLSTSGNIFFNREHYF